ncbi:hypothetical protein B1745_07415 (plasmid) [Lactobacillus amylolyticus]|uniref:hypothetical protein n=1 Tax=Lactobacillus amylolyticus TaxID=83683 RepID=UPI0009BADF2A|nr:hypothetical protein [Lactobacillus amylolyticus]ARD07440.1 hypothetical protein B1745_07415 [Lactobacillus amylolyticus]
MNKYINPNSIVMLFKFVQNKKKYLNDFEKGNLYFSSLQSFINLELNTKNDKTGDKNEGNIHQEFNNLRSFCIAGLEIPIRDIHGLTADYGIENYQKINLGICSFFAFQFKDLEKENNNSTNYRIKSSVLDDLYETKDGDRILYAVNNVSRLQQECRDNNLGYGLIKYYDPQNIKDLRELTEHPEFCKIHKYSFQHEFRIVKNLKDGGHVRHLESIKDDNFKSNILGK